MKRSTKQQRQIFWSITNCNGSEILIKQKNIFVEVVNKKILIWFVQKLLNNLKYSITKNVCIIQKEKNHIFQFSRSNYRNSY